MNKKAITAIENKKLLKNIKKNNNIKFIYKNIQYREAIIEILKKEKDIGIIFTVGLKRFLLLLEVITHGLRPQVTLPPIFGISTKYTSPHFGLFSNLAPSFFIMLFIP